MGISGEGASAVDEGVFCAERVKGVARRVGGEGEDAFVGGGSSEADLLRILLDGSV